MTAEIAIMNRNAVVLAADSATTVSSWKDGKLERRYFKGANKLFELSCYAPVGLMINGSAALQGVPWELAVKAFRDHLGDNKHDSLAGYATHFLEFIENNDHLFNDEQRLNSLINAVGPTAWRLHLLIKAELGLPENSSTAQSSLQDVEAAFQQVKARISEIKPHPMIEEADIQSAIAKCGGPFELETAQNIPLFLEAGDRGHLVSEFTKAFIELALREFTSFSGATGIVIAGYGKDEYYPSLEVFECYGFLDRKLIFTREDDKCKMMGPGAPAVIEPFATTSTINTFRFGVAPDAFNAILDSTERALTDLAKTVLAESSPQTPVSEARISELVAEVADRHTDEWFKSARNHHFTPLSNVIHSLPLPDMAALAKSLIELESLKERVTKPSESVAGPIDVAVISKYDGFVWINRKHYFKPELNPRFMRRFESL